MIQIHPSQESFILTIRPRKALKYRRRFRNCTTWTKIWKVQVCIHRWQVYDTYEGHTIDHWNYAENDNKNGNRNLISLFRELGLAR